jgi:hypothetical protein
MVNVDVKEFKIKINCIEYTFRLDFRALLKFNNKYENGMSIFNEFLSGKNIYDCIIKILSCSCIEKDFTEKELLESVGFNFRTMKLFDEITFALVEGIVNDEKGSNKEKN